MDILKQSGHVFLNPCFHFSQLRQVRDGENVHFDGNSSNAIGMIRIVIHANIVLTFMDLWNQLNHQQPHFQTEVTLRSAEQVQRDLAATVPEPRNDYEFIKQGLRSKQPLYKTYGSSDFDSYNICRDEDTILKMVATAGFTTTNWRSVQDSTAI